MRSFKRFSGFRPVLSFGVFALCLGTLVGFSAPPVWAQNAAGGVISGQVTDQQGAPQTWGVITDQSTIGALSGIGGTAGGVPAINPRQMEFGLRLHF